MFRLNLCLLLLLSFEAMAQYKGQCIQRIEESKLLLQSSLNGIRLQDAVGLGSLYGAGLGLSNAVGDQIDLNNYNNNLDDSLTSKPNNPRFIQDTLVGAASGAAVGASVFFVKKKILKSKIRRLTIISQAFEALVFSDWSVFRDDEEMEKAFNIILPRGNSIEINELRSLLFKYQETQCSYNGKSFSIKKLKRFMRNEIK
jgi:hypothetical protein